MNDYKLVPVELIEHVRHARRELTRHEVSPMHVRQRLAQKITDLLPAAPAVQGEPVAFRYRTSESAMWNYVDWRGPDEVEKDNCEIQYLSATPQPAEQQPAPDVSESKAKTPKESWWAGYRAGKGLSANTPRQDAIAAPDVAGLVEALEGLLPFVTSDSVECRGDKCREHWCLSCWDEETVRETVKNIRTAIAKADEALAAHRKGGEK